MELSKVYLGDSPAKVYLGDTLVSGGESNGVLISYNMRMYLQNVDYSNNDDYTISDVYSYLPVRTVRMDQPNPVVLNFQSAATSVNIYTDAAKTDLMQTISVGGALTCEVYNLIPNRTYYWVTNTGEEGSFQTSGGTVRLCKVDETINMRDLGGWSAMNNKTVKYGKLYRTAEWNGKHGFYLTQDGINTCLNVLGIGAELDLRHSGEVDSDTPDDVTDDITESALGPDVPYERDSIYAYDSIADTLPEVKKCWDFILTNIRQGRGVAFHCWAGADRTGTLAWLLEGLLGVSRSDMDKDYELTSFAEYGGYMIRQRNDSTRLKPFATTYINGFTGSTVHEKVVSFWKSIGVTDAEIEEFRTIMLE